MRPFGEWNEVPTDAELTADWRSRDARFGAVTIGFTLDVVELWLDTPLRDLQDASLVAHEQFGFCADIVDQGTETVQALVQALLGSHSWYFWWD